ncbi:hypothetical protein MACK_001260 [Theileria orientalis]|uniref:MACPF domain-containing protein n=1 Tax=Theileria orientalis TaxID=68886 RepID=A0A976MCQ0_THEOR|nr:hypothetical protein MACK_001260 [Theileria orientalis]
MLIRNSLCNEYLGCGYNLSYNNKKEAEESADNDVMDTNYKNPVVKFNFSGDMSNLNNTLQYLHPDGTYIYSSPNCSIKEENKLEQSQNKNERMLTSELSIDVINANTDANLNKSKENKAHKNKLEKTIYCSTFVVGINQAHHIEYTRDFIAAVLNLKRTLKAEKKKGCTIKLYKKKVCSNSRQSWNNFLNSYGTHYISKIVLGGKIVYNEEEGISSDADSKSSNINLSLTGIDVKNNNDKSNLLNKEAKNLSTSVYGGVTYDNNKHWFNELKNDPVPIKLILTSFKDIFHKYGILNEYIRFIKIH